MPQVDWHIALTFGVLLSAALVAGFLAHLVRLPKVTAYLLVGLLLGPHTYESLPRALVEVIPQWLTDIAKIPESHLSFLDPIAKFAMALVLFSLGCSFNFGRFRRRAGRILRLSAGELGLTFVLVAGGLAVLGESWAAAILFAALALATAPATTVLVLKENRAEGPVTNYASTLVGINNLVSIVLFQVLFAVMLSLHGKSDASLGMQLARLAGSLSAAFGVGLAAGLVTTIACALLPRRSWLAALIAVTTLLLGVSQQFQLPYLLTFLIMGATVANTSDRTQAIVNQLDELTGLLCVIFFVIHGAELDVRALLAAGVIGTGYIVLRLSGKYFGIFFSTARRDGKVVRRWLGATLTAQAGAAIALSAMAAEQDPELGGHLRNIILGTVVFFELVGPVLIRQAVMRAGEVPLGHAIHHTETTPWEELRVLVNRFLMALGRDPWRGRKLGMLKVSDILHRDVQGIPASANYRRVIDYIEHSHDNTMPVVDSDGAVVGVIRYLDLQSEHFDPGLGSLVCAADLAITSFSVLHADDPAIHAWRAFKGTRDDCLPVVADAEPARLVGVVRRRDVLRLAPSESGAKNGEPSTSFQN